MTAADTHYLDQFDVYPPGDWAPRSEPTTEEIESALDAAHQWWWYSVEDPHTDDCLETYLDHFERFLAGEVGTRDRLAYFNSVDEGTDQSSLTAY